MRRRKKRKPTLEESIKALAEAEWGPTDGVTRTLDPTRACGMTLAQSTDRSHNGVMSAKGAEMSPMMNETHLPEGMTLQHRPVCTPGSDERPLLRDRDGHVMAAVEAWTPESGTTTRDLS